MCVGQILRRAVLACVILLSFAATVYAERQQRWIYAGQSNLAGFNGLSEVVTGRTPGLRLFEARSGIPGTPIQSWLKDDPWQERPKTGWKLLEATLKKQPDVEIAGMVWYQGESNTQDDAHLYEKRLNTVIANMRKLVGKPKLPVVVVQLATCRKGDWGWAMVREAQRRVALDDPHVEIVCALDLEIGDNIVHLSKAAKDEVGRRQGMAALRLVYGHKDVTFGPRFKRAFFTDAHRQVVVVEFDDVAGGLKLGEGWQQGFSAVNGLKFGNDLKQWGPPSGLPAMRDALIWPSHAQLIGTTRVALLFDKPLSTDARIGWGMTPSACIGPHRSWDMPITGVTDDTGIPAVAFALSPIAPKPSDVKLPDIVEPAGGGLKPIDLSRPFQIAFNGMGRSRTGMLGPNERAGAPGFEQAYWNGVHAGLEAHLRDSRGRLTPIGIHTACWYASFVGSDASPDHRLLGSYNRDRNSPQRVVGLKPNTPYDIVLYHHMPDRADEAVSYAVGTPIMHKNGRVKGVNAQTTVIMKQPVGDAKADNPHAFARYVEATKANGYTGNYLVLHNIKSDERGEILVWPTPTKKGGRCRFTAMQVIYRGEG